jgi:hydroxymethylglutaryl-CoA lyase
VTEHVRVVEVGPRDGLQNEREIVPTDAKVELIRRLVAAGYEDIEVTSFVRPRWIPQLADASDVLSALRGVQGATFWALVPNERGLERALDAGLSGVATFMSASETHNLKNVNRTIRESLGALREVIGTAVAEGLRVRAYVSTVFGCPYEGAVSVERAVEIAAALREMGAEQISLGDTTGMANPRQVGEVIAAMHAGRSCRSHPWRCTCTTPKARRWPTCSPGCRPGCAPSTPRSRASAAAPTRRAPRATPPAKTS